MWAFCTEYLHSTVASDLSEQKLWFEFSKVLAMFSDVRHVSLDSQHFHSCIKYIVNVVELASHCQLTLKSKRSPNM